MIKEIWQSILRLFGITAEVIQADIRGEYTTDYQDTRGINLTAIFANKLATLTVCESNVNIADDSKRSIMLQDVLTKLWSRSKKLTSRVLGTGGAVVIPYVAGGKLYFDIISQDRLNINTTQGEDITSATVLADNIVINNQNYYRWVDYQLINSSLIIRCRATRNGSSISLETVDKWKDIAPEITVQNVTQLPFAFIKSPIDNRKQSNLYGVPITYGTQSILKRIEDCLKQIDVEFEDKKAVLFMDDRMVSKDKNDGIKKPFGKHIKLIKGGGDTKGSMIDIFDPAIRDSSYYNRLQHLFELLEKAVGTSKGILTEQSSTNATATEIKRGSYDTFAMVNDIRKTLEKGVSDFCYACDVWANYYSLSPVGNYSLTFTWSDALVENSTEEWQQLLEGQSLGVVRKAEIRQHLHNNETIDESQSIIDEIQRAEPNLASVLGADNGGE